jgi:CxxC-x17-CxxC domain-containing protein
MTFEDYLKTGNKRPQGKSNHAIKERLKKVNKHINFERESEKTNARKDHTIVTCIACKEKFTLPFKPRKPEIYCDSCFKKMRKSNSKK